MDADQLIATLRLRLQPVSELVTLEHQMYFRDERNRAAEKSVRRISIALRPQLPDGGAVSTIQRLV